MIISTKKNAICALLLWAFGSIAMYAQIVDVGPVVIGNSDPGTAALLRVGGGITLSGELQCGNTVDSSVPNQSTSASFTATAQFSAANKRSRVFRVQDRFFADYVQINGGRGKLVFGSDYSGRMDVLAINSGDGTVIVGSDPGTSALFRVGGGIASSGEMQGGNIANASTANQYAPASFTATAQFSAANQRSRVFRVQDRFFADYVQINGGRGKLVFGSDYSGRMDVLSINSGDGTVIVGNDPTPPGDPAPGTFRVGGGADFKGRVRAQEVVVTLNGWADNVFAPDYRLAPLSEVAEHITEKRHLPGIPSEAEIVDKGLSMGEMQRLHMAKIEELTLYAIQQERRLATAERAADEMRLHNQRLEARLAALEKALQGH